MVGTHTGSLYGIPATGRHIDVIEVGLWRVEDGVIAEAWYFGDELGLLERSPSTHPISQRSNSRALVPTGSARGAVRCGGHMRSGDHHRCPPIRPVRPA